MAKALIIYATRTRNTQEIAQLVAEGIRMGGMEANVMNITEFDKDKVDVQTYDAVVLGAATYHGDMLQSMKTCLFVLEKLGLEGKVGGAFGSYGWSGEAPGRIYETMKHIFKMKMVSEPLRLKAASLGGGIKMAHDYGAEIVKQVP